MRLASSPALSNWTAFAYYRNRPCARTASAPGVCLGVGHCYLWRGQQRGVRRAWSCRSLMGEEGWRRTRHAPRVRTKVLQPHAHPCSPAPLLPCPHSKSGDNSSSSLGDVVTGTRRPTPPASGKSCLQPRGGRVFPGWGGLSRGVAPPPCNRRYPILSPPYTYSGTSPSRIGYPTS